MAYSTAIRCHAKRVSIETKMCRAMSALAFVSFFCVTSLGRAEDAVPAAEPSASTAASREASPVRAAPTDAAPAARPIASVARARVREEVPVPPAQELLSQTFTSIYGINTSHLVQIINHTDAGVTQQARIQVIRKKINGRLHGLANFTSPDHMRGMRILTVENVDRNDDYFVYLPALRRVRRVANAQRADAFLGSDMTFEDIEPKRLNNFELIGRSSMKMDGETVHVVMARPLYESAYDRVEFFIAEKDAAWLEHRYYRRGSFKPFKIIRAPREYMEVVDGYAFPTRVFVQDLEKGSLTELRMLDLKVNPDLDDKLFSVVQLEKNASIPGLGE